MIYPELHPQAPKFSICQCQWESTFSSNGCLLLLNVMLQAWLIFRHLKNECIWSVSTRDPISTGNFSSNFRNHCLEIYYYRVNISSAYDSDLRRGRFHNEALANHLSAVVVNVTGSINLLLLVSWYHLLISQESMICVYFSGCWQK